MLPGTDQELYTKTSYHVLKSDLVRSPVVPYSEPRVHHHRRDIEDQYGWSLIG